MAFVLAFLYGCMDTVCKMLNVKAGRIFGPVNGSLFNYLEATVCSFVLMLLLSGGAELSLAHIASVPYWVYLGGILGVIAMVIIIFATPKTNVILATILAMLGNLGGALMMDYFLFEGKISLLKIAGLVLILTGAAWIGRQKQQSDKETESV